MKKRTGIICIIIALIIGVVASALAHNWDKINNKNTPEVPDTEITEQAPEVNVEETEEVTLI